MFGKKYEGPKPSIEDPFAGDLLSRSLDITRITEFTDLIRKPYVITLNSSWGSGKTTYVSMWHKYLQSEYPKKLGYSKKEKNTQNKRPSVFFNAWKHDFTGIPIISLFAEIEAEVKRYAKITESETSLLQQLEDAKNKLVNFASKNLKTILSCSTSTLTAVADSFVPGSSALLSPSAKLIEKAIDSFTQSKNELEEFRKSLADIAAKLRGGEDTPPLYIFIDELDRCRPTYAVELLESIKHLFDVEGVLFILSTDREQLSNTVKSLYGEIDADGYLRRFIDYEYTLPDPESINFIEYILINTLNIIPNDYITSYNNDKNNQFNRNCHDIVCVFDEIITKCNLKLRDIEKIFQSSSLLLSKIDLHKFTLLQVIAWLSVLNFCDYKSYMEIKKGKIPTYDFNLQISKIKAVDDIRYFAEPLAEPPKSSSIDHYKFYYTSDRIPDGGSNFYGEFLEENNITFQNFVFNNLELMDNLKTIY